MKFFSSVAVGVASGAAAVFLHLVFPPFGIALSVLGSFTAIWIVGRKYGKRFYKIVSAIAWMVIFSRAATFGSGKEILIQGDTLGNNFLMLAFLALVIAVALPAN